VSTQLDSGNVARYRTKDLWQAAAASWLKSAISNYPRWGDLKKRAIKRGLCRRLSHGVTIPSNLVNCPHTCLSVSFVNSRAED
jgi:hypothetical protein